MRRALALIALLEYLVGPGPALAAATPTGGAVTVAGGVLGTLAAADTYHVIKRISIPNDSGWDYITADTEGRRLYVPHGTEVVVLDLDSGAVVGKITGQKGVHGRWETELFARYERQVEPAVLPATAERIEDPVAFTFAVLRESYARAQESLAADREVAGTVDFAETLEDDRYGDGYYSRLFEREGGRFVARLSAAAHAVGSLWCSAWEDAVRPVLDTSFRFPYVRRQSRLILASLDGAGAALTTVGAVHSGAAPERPARAWPSSQGDGGR